MKLSAEQQRLIQEIRERRALLPTFGVSALSIAGTANYIAAASTVHKWYDGKGAMPEMVKARRAASDEAARLNKLGDDFDALLDIISTLQQPEPPFEAAATFDPHANYVKVKGGWERRKPDAGSDAT